MVTIDKEEKCESDEFGAGIITEVSSEMNLASGEMEGMSENERTDENGEVDTGSGPEEHSEMVTIDKDVTCGNDVFGAGSPTEVSSEMKFTIIKKETIETKEIATSNGSGRERNGPVAKICL